MSCNSSNFTSFVDQYGWDFSPTDWRTIGICILVVDMFLIFPYFLVIKIFKTNEEFVGNLSYTILMHLSVSDLYRCFTEIFNMAFFLFPDNIFPISYYILTEGLSWSGLFITNTMCLVLAICRFDVIVGVWKFRTNPKHFYNALVYLTYALTAFLLTALAITEYNMCKNRQVVRWFNTRSCDCQRTYIAGWIFNATLVPYHDIIDFGGYTANGISMFLYVVCIGFIFVQRKMYNITTLNSKEYTLFLQTFIPCATKIFLNLTWRYFSKVTPFEVERPIRMGIRVIEYGYHPYLYLSVNRRLRGAFLRTISSGRFKLTSTKHAWASAKTNNSINDGIKTTKF